MPVLRLRRGFAHTTGRWATVSAIIAVVQFKLDTKVRQVPMRIATINIRHGGGQRISRLLSFISNLGADILVITEYRCNQPGTQLSRGLKELGYGHRFESVSEPRKNGILVASRLEMQALGLMVGPPGDEHRLLATKVGRLNLVAVYFPQGHAKSAIFASLDEHCRSYSSVLVIGDFNTGLPRLDETGSTFLCVEEFEALKRVGLIDLWRTRHPERREYSWYSNAGNGFRLDHAFGSHEVDKSTKKIYYDHECRENGFTDHSALIVELGA